MKLIIIYGTTAVGKLTTAKELSKKTKYPILHNHMTIDLAENFFPYNSLPFNNLIRKIRLDIVNEMLDENAPGLIWTTGFPNKKDVRAFYRKLDNLVKKKGGNVSYVKLVCDFEQQKQRVLGKERAEYNKANTLRSLNEMMKILDSSAITPHQQTLVIDNSNLSVQRVVLQIIKFFSLEKTKK